MISRSGCMMESKMNRNLILLVGTLCAASLAGGSHTAAAAAFGTDIAALTTSQLYDGNGSPTTSNNCNFVTLNAWCGPDHRESSTYNATSVGDAWLGKLSGRVTTDVYSILYVGQADLEAHWFDTFTAVSSGAPAGTQAQISLELDISGHVQPSKGSPFPYTRTQASMTLGGKDAPWLLGTQMSADGSTTVTNDNALLVDLNTPFILYGNLFATTGAQKPIHDASTDDGEADALVHYFVRVLTPGITLLSESGTNYSGEAPVDTAIPEPVSGLLLLGSFLLLISSRTLPARRRNSR
jgi:hypothetical protein